jgi:protein LSM14
LYFLIKKIVSPRQQNQQQQQRPQRSQRRSNSTSGDRIKYEPLKFDGEFNFEEANARFEQEIEKEMENKLKISNSKSMTANIDSMSPSSQSAMTQQELQDQAHILMKQKVMDMDHHHQTMDLHKPLHEMSAEETKNFYDKTSSFFDRISCEANDKLNQQLKPKNWKEERKMNAETFGMVLRQHNERMNHARNYYRNNNNNNMYNQRRPQQQDMQQRSSYRNNNNNNNMMSYNKMNQQRMSMPMGQQQQRNNGYIQYRRPEMEVGNGMQQRSTNYRRYNAGSR